MVAEYRAGLDAELALLRQLDALSVRQHHASVGGDISDLPSIHDARDGVMVKLVAVEHELKPLRAALADHRQALQYSKEFQKVATLHTEAAEMVARIIASDRQSVDALKEAERHRDVILERREALISIALRTQACDELELASLTGLTPDHIRRSGRSVGRPA